MTEGEIGNEFKEIIIVIMTAVFGNRNSTGLTLDGKYTLHIQNPFNEDFTTVKRKRYSKYRILIFKCLHNYFVCELDVAANR